MKAVGPKENICRWEEVKDKISVSICVMGKGKGLCKSNKGKSNQKHRKINIVTWKDKLKTVK